LAFADECVRNCSTQPRPGCPFPASQLKRQKDSIEQLVQASWLQWGRIFERDWTSTDEEVIDLSRKREFIRSWEVMKDQVQDKFAGKGRWLPMEHAPEGLKEKAQQQAKKIHWNKPHSLKT